MKKLTVLSMMFLFMASVVMGQESKLELKGERVPLKKLAGNMVNEKAKGSFNVDFPNVTNVKWQRVGYYDEVMFTKDGKQMKGYYDTESNLVGTTQNKTFADLPMKGQQEIKTKYPDYSIGPVLFFDDNEACQTDMILWNIQFDDVDSYFVELNKGTSKLVVQVFINGSISLFKKLS
jgi:hypothetical protein